MQKLSIIQELKKYRWLLEQLIARDLKKKYRKSVLGYFWSILNPLLMMTIMTIVFSRLFRFQIPNYPVYLLSGQLIFSFFCEATNAAMYGIWGNGAMIKKVYLPKYIFPLSSVLSIFTTMIFSLAALFIVMICTGTQLHITMLYIPIVLLYLLLFAIGMGILLSALFVFFRDLGHLWGVFLTALNYLTPIFYPADILPAWAQNILTFNPIYNYINVFRKVILYGQYPTLGENVICLTFSIGILILGSLVFKNKQKKFILYI